MCYNCGVEVLSLNSDVKGFGVMRTILRLPLLQLTILLVLLCLLGGGRPVAAGLPPWTDLPRGKFVCSLALDAQGRVWIGTEDHGVWMADPAAPSPVWTHFGPQDGLAEDSATALACDPKGRLWVGHLRHGVSVTNGQSWKSYDAATGPLGNHVFALAVNPKDGDVWTATEAGLTRYSQSKDRWQYYTQADGLPSNQVQALAFDKNGTLYAGTQCDGLAIGSAADDYQTWQHVTGPTRPLPLPSGAGLPENRINALLVAHDGSVYAGTPSGLAGSQDGGKTWHYLRGADWLAKLVGSGGNLPPNAPDLQSAPLAEDSVTALGEDSAGRLWIGHWSKGVEVFDPSTSHPIALPALPSPNVDLVSALLTGAAPQMLIGGYGSGLARALPPDAATSAAPTAARSILPPAPLPSPAAPPTVAELKALLAAVPAGKPALKPGTGLFLGDDWQTQGDWVGRYGRQYALLCGFGSPFDQTVTQGPGYSISEGIGPHHKKPDGVYTYIATLDTPDRRFPYSPLLGHRRDAEVNDGSWDPAQYSSTWEGPDLWITFQVPEGLHRASFYFVNNDGHVGVNRWRDFLLELKADAPTVEAEDAAPALARARVAEFYGGVYKQFLVQGPATCHMKIGRCYSFCTKLQAVFLDKLSGPLSTVVPFILPAPAPPPAGAPPPVMATQSRSVGIAFGPPDLPAASASDSPVAAAARALWSALDAARGSEGGAALQARDRALAYRAALADQASSALLANWRWSLCFWTDADHAQFDRVMPHITTPPKSAAQTP